MMAIIPALRPPSQISCRLSQRQPRTSDFVEGQARYLLCFQVRLITWALSATPKLIGIVSDRLSENLLSRYCMGVCGESLRQVKVPELRP